MALFYNPAQVRDPADAAALGWALGCYKFGRYKTEKSDGKGGAGSSAEQGAPTAEAAGPCLMLPPGGVSREVEALARAYYWCR